MAKQPTLTGTVRYDRVTYRHDKPDEIERLFKALEAKRDHKTAERLVKKGLITGIELPEESPEEGGENAPGQAGNPAPKGNQTPAGGKSAQQGQGQPENK
jgi:hypothetical protein